MPQMRLKPGLCPGPLLEELTGTMLPWTFVFSIQELCFAKMKKELSTGSCMRGKRLLWACTKWEMR